MRLLHQNLLQTVDSCSFIVWSLSHVQLFATQWTAARQASLPFTISWSLLKLMSIESVKPSNHPILCRPLLFLPSFLMWERRIESSSHLLLFSHSVVSDSLWPHGLQHARLSCPSLSPRVCSDSCPFYSVDDAIQPSHPLFPPSPALSLSQHQGLFWRVSSSHQLAKISVL